MIFTFKQFRLQCTQDARWLACPQKSHKSGESMQTPYGKTTAESRTPNLRTLSQTYQPLVHHAALRQISLHIIKQRLTSFYLCMTAKDMTKRDTQSRLIFSNTHCLLSNALQSFDYTSFLTIKKKDTHFCHFNSELGEFL